jgi:hypothetical protein
MGGVIDSIAIRRLLSKGSDTYDLNKCKNKQNPGAVQMSSFSDEGTETELVERSLMMMAGSIFDRSK